MVYCGKPSRGCQMCRTRRIKCDETKPTCDQCTKSRRKCPGYRDEFDLVFRNETLATERRARKTRRKMSVASEGGWDENENENGKCVMILASGKRYRVSEKKSTSITGALKLPLDQQAACHFISNYVLIPRYSSNRGFMEFLLPLATSDSPMPHFKDAFDACALASLSNRIGPGSNYGQKALSSYTRALASTHEALRDPERAKADATLATVLLLGLFENITARQLGMFSWGSHIEGAVQLVKARGREQLESRLGLSIFIAVRTQMIIHALATGQAPPMGVDWWTQDAAMDPHATAMQRINIRTGELRAEVNQLMATAQRNASSVEKILELIRKCQEVDRACTEWPRDLPETYQWRTMAWEDHVPQGDFGKAEVFPGRVDAYQDFCVASVWNLMRCARLILASLVVRCAAWVCSPVDYRTTPEYAAAARTCVEMITDIIASVPYQLGWFSSSSTRRGELLEKAASVSGFACGEEDARKGLPGYLLTWPLACIHGQDYLSDSQRAWVKGRLRFIGDEVGVRYANMLTEINVRVPSMLIRKDGMMANPLLSAHDFEKMLSLKKLPSETKQDSGQPTQRRVVSKDDQEKSMTSATRPRAPSLPLE